MKSNEINSDITFTAQEAEIITGKLVEAGIDRELVERVIIGHVFEGEGCDKSSNCVHCHKGKNPCTTYFRVAGGKGCSKTDNCLLREGCTRYFKVAGSKGCDKTENCVHTHPCNNYFRAAGGRGCDKTENCRHDLGCDRYFRAAGPSDIRELKNALLEKKIDIKKIDPKIDKLLRD